MEWYILFIFYTIILFLLLFSGYWVPFALGTTGLIGLIFISDITILQGVGDAAWNSVNSFTLTSIPLFILMGEIILHSGLSNRFFHSTSFLLKKVPGGLLQTNIITSAFFSAISGSSLATVATVGSVAYPELRKRNYSKPKIYGSLGGGGSLGILIPPSIPLIIYGSMVKESVGRLFMAAIVPGIIATLIFIIFIILTNIKMDNVKVDGGEKATTTRILKSIADLLPMIGIIVLITGSIFMGFATPTEAAGLGVVFALGVSFIYRGVTFENLNNALKNTIRITSMVLFIVIGAQILTYLLVKSGINRALTTWITDIDPSAITFIIIIIVIYLILGCLIDGLSLMFLTIPILWPLTEAMGFDAIWFGILLVILIEISQITPPVGMNLFVLQGISKDDNSLPDIIKGNLPYFFLYLLLAVIIILFPELVMWLPSKML